MVKTQFGTIAANASGVISFAIQWSSDFYRFFEMELVACRTWALQQQQRQQHHTIWRWLPFNKEILILNICAYNAFSVIRLILLAS